MKKDVRIHIEMSSPSGEELKSVRLQAGLSQIEAAALMGYPVQSGSRGGLQSRTWQALESSRDSRNMPGPIFTMFQLMTGTHADYALVKRETPAELDALQNITE
jgi:transcriptional regulator with XRE-family HTH domain